MNITYLQKKWLDEHGGRSINDVQRNNRGLYVLMWNGGRGKNNGGYEKIYIPKDKADA